jgi:hypothetical protein
MNAFLKMELRWFIMLPTTCSNWQIHHDIYGFLRFIGESPWITPKN